MAVNFFSGFLAKGTGSASFVEVVAPGYARAPVAFGPIVTGTTVNVSAFDTVVFLATAPWPTVTQEGLFDTLGNLLMWWPMAANVTLNAGGLMSVPSGSINLYFDAVNTSPLATLQFVAGSVPAIRPGVGNVTTAEALQVAAGVLSAAVPAVVSFQNAISAFAGGGQASATQLSAVLNRVTVVATLADSVKLPVAAGGLQITVANASAVALNLFPSTGDAINALAANAAFSVAAGKTAIAYSMVPGFWQIVLSA